MLEQLIGCMPHKLGVPPVYLLRSWQAGVWGHDLCMSIRALGAVEGQLICHMP